MPRTRCLFLAVLLAWAWAPVWAQSASQPQSTPSAASASASQGATPAQSPTRRLRGTVKSFDGVTLVLLERSGETHTLGVAENLSVSEVVPIEPAAIRPGSYIGTAAMPAADGNLSALEVLVFPEAARGTAEGHTAWDLQPGSTMTNATVAEVVSASAGRSLKLRYKDGEKTVIVPDNVPIVTLQPGSRAMLVDGAKVLVTARMADGKATALRALVGKDGLVPPM